MHTTPNRPVRSSAAARRVLGTARVLALAGLLAGAASLTACNKHGRFTQAHMSAAKVRMAEMKSATEFQMAHQAFLAGDLKKALRHIDYSLELNPRIPKSHVLRGRIFLEAGNLENCAVALRNAEEIDPKNVDAAYYQGLLAERLDRREDALRHYTRAGELDPANPQHAIAAAEMLVSLARLDDAERALTRDGVQFQHSAGVRQAMAQIALLRNQPDRAVTLFQEARLLAPDDHSILENLASAQVAAGQFAQAEANLARLLTNPDFSARRDLLRLRADCLTRIDRHVEARDVLMGLVKDERGTADADAWNQIGQISVLVRDWNRVRTAALRLIAISPDSPTGYVLRGLEQRARGQHLAAAESFAHAVERDRTPDNLILLGMSLQSLGRDADARACFTNALNLRPGDPAATRLLAGADSSER